MVMSCHGLHINTRTVQSNFLILVWTSALEPEVPPLEVFIFLLRSSRGAPGSGRPACDNRVKLEKTDVCLRSPSRSCTAEEMVLLDLSWVLQKFL